jgi:Asp-tRNA(Asn)/Glu-tRNA(Gln) amidotransferase A subunit family amidase
MSALQWLTATEIAAAYAARKLSPVELVAALIAEIETHNAACGAFIRIDPEGALAAA